MLGQDCTNGHVYYYMRVVHLVCGFNQSHSSYYYIWNGCSDKTAQMENCIYMLVVHPVCGFNQTHFFILFYLYVSRNGFDETAHIQTYTITS